jgi:hypothetical protein
VTFIVLVVIIDRDAWDGLAEHLQQTASESRAESKPTVEYRRERLKR